MLGGSLVGQISRPLRPRHLKPPLLRNFLSKSTNETYKEIETMGEISNLLQQKAGLSPDKAQEVEQVVIEHIKSRVPSEFQGMLGSVLGERNPSADGEAATESGGLGGLLGAATSMFGNMG